MERTDASARQSSNGLVRATPRLRLRPRAGPAPPLQQSGTDCRFASESPNRFRPGRSSPSSRSTSPLRSARQSSKPFGFGSCSERYICSNPGSRSSSPSRSSLGARQKQSPTGNATSEKATRSDPSSRSRPPSISKRQASDPSPRGNGRVLEYSSWSRMVREYDDVDSANVSARSSQDAASQSGSSRSGAAPFGAPTPSAPSRRSPRYSHRGMGRSFSSDELYRDEQRRSKEQELKRRGMDRALSSDNLVRAQERLSKSRDMTQKWLRSAVRGQLMHTERMERRTYGLAEEEARRKQLLENQRQLKLETSVIQSEAARIRSLSAEFRERELRFGRQKILAQRQAREESLHREFLRKREEEQLKAQERRDLMMAEQDRRHRVEFIDQEFRMRHKDKQLLVDQKLRVMEEQRRQIQEMHRQIQAEASRVFASLRTEALRQELEAKYDSSLVKARADELIPQVLCLQDVSLAADDT